MTPEHPALTDEGHLLPDAFVTHCAQTALALLDVLQQERVALAGQASSDVQTLFDRKAELADRLDRLESIRRERWPGDPDALLRAAAPAMAERWREYVTTLADCREINAISGRLVQARQRHVRDALALLRGTADGADATYDASGARPDGLDPMALGSA